MEQKAGSRWNQVSLGLSLMVVLIFCILLLSTGCKSSQEEVIRGIQVAREGVLIMKQTGTSGSVSIRSGGSPGVYAQQKFGLETDFEVHVNIQVNAAAGEDPLPQKPLPFGPVTPNGTGTSGNNVDE